MDGLSSNLIHSIYKDPGGFIWLGTSLGLNRFDGVDIKRYKEFESESVSCVVGLDSNTLVVGMEPGLKKFDKRTEKSVPVNLDVKPTIVRDIKVIDSEHFLVATEQGLYLVSGDHVKKIVIEKNASAVNYIHCIYEQDKAVFWLATGDGLCRYDLKKDRVDLFRKPGDNHFSCMTILDSVFYVASYDNGVFTFSEKTGVFKQVPFTKDYYMKALSGDQNGNLYLGTDGRGLMIWSPKTNRLNVIDSSPDHPDLINSNTILSFRLDDDIFWIGTNSGGLNYNPSESKLFNTYSFGSFRSADANVRSFFIDKDLKMIGTRNGLIYISEKDRNIKEYYANDPKSRLRANIITQIYKYSGKILIGTYGGGLCFFNPKTLDLSDFSTDPVFMHGSIFCMQEDHSGNLWLGTSEGLFCYDKDFNLIKNYNVTNSGLLNNSILYMFCDSNNSIWIAPLNSNVCLLDTKTGIIRSDVLPKEYDTIQKKTVYIYEDTGKNIWLCTSKGLMQVDPSHSKIRLYTVNHFLPNNSVKSVIEDNEGYLWVATGKGIVKYSLKNGTSEQYGMSDGIVGSDFNRIARKTSGGIIWWGSNKGLLYMNPASRENTKKNYFFNPVITSLSINNKEFSTKENWGVTPEYLFKRISLSSDQNNISFKFSLFSYSWPEFLHYEYKLDGLEKEWNKSNQNEATYFNLKPGKYTFRLRNPDDPEREVQFLVEIRLGYYWYVMGAFIVLFAIAAFFLIRKLKIAEQKRVTEKVKNSRERQTAIPVEAIQSIEQRLIGLMEVEKKYLNPDLRANDVAVMLNCSLAELSQILNGYLHTSFTDFVNKYRFKEFNSYLTKDSLAKYTLNGISEKSGFNSRTTFYRVVKKETGKSPIEYVESLGLMSRSSKKNN